MFNQAVTPWPHAPRICLTNPLVVSVWCAEMNCTEQQLRAAVYAIGSQPYWVRRYFQPVKSR